MIHRAEVHTQRPDLVRPFLVSKRSSQSGIPAHPALASQPRSSDQHLTSNLGSATIGALSISIECISLYLHKQICTGSIVSISSSNSPPILSKLSKGWEEVVNNIFIRSSNMLAPAPLGREEGGGEGPPIHSSPPHT